MGVGSAVIRTPDQRLRVFVSSTMRELERERAAAADAIRSLKLTPVLFELGARPHPPRRLYRAYLDQSHVFVGIYGEEYGWIAPRMEISGLEDEYLLWGDRPALIYVREPAPNRDDRLKALLRRIEEHDRACYKTFSSPDELGTMLSDDLAVMLSERFETTSAAPGVRTAPVPEAPEASPAARRRTRFGVALAAAVVVILGLWLTGSAGPPKSSLPEAKAASEATGAPESPSLAVLPFVNMSPDPNQEYFSDGLSEELLNVLSNVPQLRVISRTSSFQFKGKNEDIRTIGRKLNVAHVLEGSVRKSGKRIRITAQLVDAATGSHLWSSTYDRDLEDIFAVQDDIARSVANASRVTLLGLEGKSSASYGTNADAYNLYLQGRQLSFRGTRESLEKAVSCLEQALQLDPGRATYWVGLASVHNVQVSLTLVPADEGFRKSRLEADKALALDPRVAEAHAILGFIRLGYDWDWDGAEASYRKALLFGPGNAKAIEGAATMAGAMGRFDEAIALHRRATRLDPLNPHNYFNLGVHASYAGRLDEAESALRKVLDLSPELSGAHAALARVCLLLDRPQAALDESRRESHPSWRRYALALAYFALGRTKEADSELAELVRRDGAGAALQIAEAYAFRRETDRAFEWLERAYTERDGGLAFLKGDPFLTSLEGDPRYKAFLRKMRLPV